MSNSKMREEFEAALPIPEGVHWDAGRNQYMTSTHHVPCVEYRGAWKGWKASRESLVIELPDASHYDGHQPALAIDDCRQAIEAAGVKVKK